MRYCRTILHTCALATATCLLVSGCFSSDDNDETADPVANEEAQGSWGRLVMEGIGNGDMFDVYVITGPGYTIERIQGFNGVGQPMDLPGNATESQFVFEMEDSAPRTATVKAYFDEYISSGGAAGSRDARLVVLQGDLDFAFQWELHDFAPAGAYQSVSGGRTRFTMSTTLTLSTHMGWDLDDDPFGSGGSYNPAADRLVEMDGMVGTFFPTVVDNTTERTLTLTYDYQEGRGIYDWVRATIHGTDTVVDMSVIQLDASLNQTSRRNYSGCFPIRYEQYTGYDLDTKIKARVVVSYNESVDASP